MDSQMICFDAERKDAIYDETSLSCDYIGIVSAGIYGFGNSICGGY